MSDKIAYTKVSDLYIEPTMFIEDSNGPLMDDTGDNLFANLVPYQLSTLFSSEGFVLLDEYGNEIH